MISYPLACKKFKSLANVETLHEIYHSPDMIKKLKHNKSVFNRFVRQDPSMQYTKLHKLYEKHWIDIGLNPLLDEIFLDK